LRKRNGLTPLSSPPASVTPRRQPVHDR